MPSRPTPHHLVRVLAVLAVVAVLASVVAACDVIREVGARSWGQATTNQAGTEHTITVTDRSGRVADVAFAPPDANLFEPVTVAPNTPNALDVAWAGGACDAATTVDIASLGAALEVVVAIEDNGMPCDAMGLPQVVRLTFAGPVDPALVKVTQ
jgi:hypothetical protein